MVPEDGPKFPQILFLFAEARLVRRRACAEASYEPARDQWSNDHEKKVDD